MVTYAFDQLHPRLARLTPQTDSLDDSSIALGSDFVNAFARKLRAPTATRLALNSAQPERQEGRPPSEPRSNPRNSGHPTNTQINSALPPMTNSSGLTLKW